MPSAVPSSTTLVFRGIRTIPFVLVLLMAAAAPVAGQVEDPLDATGFQPSRAYVSVLPWERIDAYSGNLLLTFTDLVLPGNAGFDLRITRAFNSKESTASRWTFGPTGIAITAATGNPRLVTSDGSKEPTFETSSGSGVFRTKGYRRYVRALSRASSPDGVTYIYGYVWNYQRFLTEMIDPFGNAITFHYVQPDETRAPLVEAIVQDLGNGQSRTVAFTHTADGRVETMTYAGRTWTYGWNSCGELDSVTPPVGPGWAFGYSSCLLTSVTTPNGGQVVYAYDMQSPAGREARVVSSRTSTGREIDPATWNISYLQTATTVDRGASQVRYEFMGSGYGEGSVTHRETRDAGVVLELEDISWRASMPVGLVDAERPWHEPQVPLVALRTVTRPTGTGFPVHDTAYTYHEDFLNDYGQPWRITETGDYSRETVRVFRHDFPTYIRGKLASETVTGGGESFTRSHGYNNQGFLTTRTVHGISTTYQPDAYGNVASETDATGFTVTTSGDRWVQTTTTTPKYVETRVLNPDGTVASRRRDAASGQPDGGSGFSEAWLYDALGRAIEERPRTWSEALQEGATFTVYDNENGQWMETRLKNSVVRQDLDGFGRVIQTKNSLEVTATTRYDADGRVVYESLPFDASNPTPAGTITTYDALGRITRRDAPDGGWITYDYDGTRFVTITGARPRLRGRARDPIDRPDVGGGRVTRPRPARRRSGGERELDRIPLRRAWYAGGGVRTLRHLPVVVRRHHGAPALVVRRAAPARLGDASGVRHHDLSI